MIDNKLKLIAERISELPQIVRSIILIGSYSDNSSNIHSDIDILIITHSDITAKKSSLIGEKINDSVNIKNKNTSFVFHNPVCERCKLLTNMPHRFHIISHSWANIKKWLKEKDFITCMWALKSHILWGENPFDEKIIPELNKSLLDEIDGIPSFIREINNVLISKNPISDSHEYEKYSRFYMHRVFELVNFFPEISTIVSLPLNSKGAKGLIEISEYFLAVQKEIEYYLHQISNE